MKYLFHIVMCLLVIGLSQILYNSYLRNKLAEERLKEVSRRAEDSINFEAYCEKYFNRDVWYTYDLSKHTAEYVDVDGVTHPIQGRYLHVVIKPAQKRPVPNWEKGESLKDALEKYNK